ncbi:hydrolase, partial [mine drainage metagenome]
VLERRFTLPRHTEVSRAVLTIAGDNDCRIGINGYVVMQKFGAPWEKPAVLEVARYLRPGNNRIVVLLKNTGSAPNPSGLIARLRMQGANGFHKSLVTDAKWSAVQVAAGANWMSGTPRKDQAVVLAAWGQGPWGGVARRKWVQNQPCPIFRKVFPVPANINHAYLYMAGLGYWKVLINGRKVGKGELESTLYDYSKAVPYQSFD